DRDAAPPRDGRHVLASLLRGASPPDGSSVGLHAGFELFEIPVEMRNRFEPRRAGAGAERFPIGTLGHGRETQVDESRGSAMQRALQLDQIERPTGLLVKTLGGGLHDTVRSDARTCARWRISISSPRRSKIPLICSRHDGSQDTTASAPVATMAS